MTNFRWTRVPLRLRLRPRLAEVPRPVGLRLHPRIEQFVHIGPTGRLKFVIA